MANCIRLGGHCYSVVPSLRESAVLGFRLDRLDEARFGAYEAAEPRDGERGCLPELGNCRLVGTQGAADARILGWRDLPGCGFRGLRLRVYDEHAACFLGALIVQKSMVIGIAQSTGEDAWGLPIDVFANGLLEPLGFMPQGLKLITDGYGGTPDWPYSATLGSLVANPGRELDRAIFAGRAFTLELPGGKKHLVEPVAPRPMLPTDTRCLYVGGLVIDAGCNVVDVRADAELHMSLGPIMLVNALACPGFDELAVFLQERGPVLLATEHDAVAFDVLAPRPEQSSRFRTLRPGVYMCGFCDSDASERASEPEPRLDDEEGDSDVVEAPSVAEAAGGSDDDTSSSEGFA